MEQTWTLAYMDSHTWTRTHELAHMGPYTWTHPHGLAHIDLDTWTSRLRMIIRGLIQYLSRSHDPQAVSHACADFLTLGSIQGPWLRVSQVWRQAITNTSIPILLPHPATIS